MIETAREYSLLEGISAIISASAWPLVTSIFLFIYRRQISRVLSVFADKLTNAKHIKAAGVELVDGLIDEAIKQTPTEKVAQTDDAKIASEVPANQVEGAKKLQDEVWSAGVDRVDATVSAGERIQGLAVLYERTREAMASGPTRTLAMDRIMASMRTVALLAKPLLPILTKSSSAGERLAAIAALQVEPDRQYSRWLCERFSDEAPFVFFHAALALRQLVADDPRINRNQMKSELLAAKRTVESFTGGEPDPNTIQVLTDALEELERPWWELN